MAVDYAALRAEFAQRFAGTPRVFRAPGRVNLLGEHTDYNDGYVFPAAMDREVCFCVRAREDRLVHLFALDLGEEETFSLDQLEWTQGGRWSNYVKAFAKTLEDAGFKCGGFEGVIRGDVPIGGGVSSSSAFTTAAGTTLATLGGLEIEENRFVQLTLDAENAATGLRGGIMDQFTSRRAKADHALLLDCRSLEYNLVPLPPMTLVVADTRKPRSLAATGYNERRAQCELGASIIGQRFEGIKALRDVTAQMLHTCSEALDEVVYRRCRHVVSEDQRVLDSVAILEAGDLVAFGQLLNASHVSLRDDYEVSCDELNVLVDIAWATPGVYGARMVGAGFGGCILALCEPDAVEPLKAKIAAEYPARCGREADVYATRAGDGAGEVV